MQPRFERRSGSGPLSLIEQPRFRAGFDFLRLRADAGEVDPDLADWWEDFSLADDPERQDMLAAVREEQRSRRVPAAGPAPVAPTVPSDDGAVPAKKRRRRRRKPGSRGDGQGAGQAGREGGGDGGGGGGGEGSGPQGGG